IKAKDDSGLKDLKISYSLDEKEWTELTTLTAPEGEKTYTFQYTMNIRELPEGSIYIKVVLTDIFGNVYGKSETAKRIFYKDLTAPKAPKISATGEDGYVEVSWEEPEEKDVAFFDLYRFDKSKNKYVCIEEKTTALNYYDCSYNSDDVLSYAVVVNDFAGNRSEFSNTVSAIPKADTEGPKIHGMVPDSGETVGKNAELHTLISDNRKLNRITVDYHKKGSEGVWTKLYSTSTERQSEDLYITWKNEDLPDGEYEFRINATDAEGNAASEYVVSYTLKKDEEREIIQKDDDKVKAEIQMENVQQAGMQYVFDAYDCYGNLSEISEYIWDFGDGTVAEGVEVLHQYVQAENIR
ncbi:MAG: PKD domain-containing protein, partial [Lachnospiraceae bacterium]|nr:PKD domain-containing protein [Lachnospiraceae bacterium]